MYKCVQNNVQMLAQEPILCRNFYVLDFSHRYMKRSGERIVFNRDKINLKVTRVHSDYARVQILFVYDS